LLLRRAVTVLVSTVLLAAGMPGGRAETPGPPEDWHAVSPGVVGRSVVYGPEGVRHTADVYAPVAAPERRRPTVLFVHGGGWRMGASTEWRDRAIELVRTRGWTAVTVNYRLTRDAAWPAQREDLRAAVATLHGRADELGIDPERTGALGDSAGGHLAALLGQTQGPLAPPVRAVVTWSGINDLAGLTEQRSAGGCPAGVDCRYRGLARTVVEELLGCTPAACPQTYRDASPASAVTARWPATLAFGSEQEQVDPRQAWVMDAALTRHGVASRVQILPGRFHARGYESVAWPDTVRFLAASLEPETSPPYPEAAVQVELDLPERSTVRARTEVALTGRVVPRQPGSSVQLQVLGGNGVWRTVRTPALEAGVGGTTYAASWTPARAGQVTWRAVWRGSGTVTTSEPRTVVAR
jgi:acetyl esterase/lipase